MLTTRIGLWTAAAALLALSGCGPTYVAARNGYNRTIARLQLAQSTELPGDQIDRVDGTYKGIVTLVEARNPNCPPSTEGNLEIGDHTLVLDYTPSIILTATILPDGSLHARTARAELNGSVRDGFIHFTVSTPVCTSRYDFRYVI